MAGRMSSSRTKPHDVHRGRGPGAGASVAQLAGPVVAPALDGATGDHRARVRRAGRDGDRPRTEPTRQAESSYAVFCLKKKKENSTQADTQSTIHITDP